MARLQHGLRVLLAVMTLGCAIATVRADVLVLAPSAWVVAATTSAQAPHLEADRPERSAQRLRRAAPPPRFVRVAHTLVHPAAPALRRAPRLYLRHGVLLR